MVDGVWIGVVKTLGVSPIIGKNGIEVVLWACAELVAAVIDAVVEAVMVILVLAHVWNRN